ncbi:gamma-glutamyl-gamma-aminobutyrate hydrolase family protein [Aquabacterium sp.]|uniref:gamma-glutamyl-gamma-aminobutyrate hydrolase family protein n=1 Tax=Aquabacterium sp. TaxID=1872578 RepID=UPI0019C2EB70|nr:gamma-glutamyl-gamma-aminobutyrate hydrolase family protein [Aquabacterium sp.]MBC7700911.1 gamma-glutamyl-gamma-aminobutyrate hydrolase family protein [Aquabacterium sp.]
MRAAPASSAPIVLVPACQKPVGGLICYTVGQKYIDAVRLAGCVPLVVPGATAQELDALLAIADGILLTGSPSNVHPSHFGEDVHDPTLPLDPDRDAWTLPIVRRALAMGMPLLGICRGFQEVNVALGGSLHQAVHEQPGLSDHRSDEALPLDEEYGFAHTAQLVPGGFLDHTLRGLPSSILSEQGEFQVNSLHGQGVNRLAPQLRVEARAPDGVVEAVTIAEPAHPGAFSLCLQWHPEWQAEGNPVSVRIFKAFGQACQAWHAGKQTS